MYDRIILFILCFVALVSLSFCLYRKMSADKIIKIAIPRRSKKHKKFFPGLDPVNIPL